MSILGYSSSYFLPQYWANTPLYGEKLIPLLDYILSTDYEHTEELATAFYNIESKYKNTSDLPIDRIEAIIEESGYGYIRNLLGQDEDALKLLVYLLVLIHQLKGSKRGIQTVLELLRSNEEVMTLSFVGTPTVSASSEVSGFSMSDYVVYSNFTLDSSKFEVNFEIRTGGSFSSPQCIASSPDYGFFLGINTDGNIVLKLGQQMSGQRAWQEINGTTNFISSRALQRNTKYYIKFSYDGSEYSVTVSTDGDRYTYYNVVPSATPLNITGGYVYLGIDKSTLETRYPFDGYISLAPFSVSSNNVILTQWFETFPVGEENTFDVDAAVDVGLVSSNFFVNFAKFVEKYVYPTLRAFKARLSLKGKVAFIPYVRQKVTFVASNLRDGLEPFMVEEENNRENHIPYEVKDNDGVHEDYFVQKSNED